MLRVTSSIQTKRSAKNVSCVFVAQKEFYFDFSKKKCWHTRVAGCLYYIHSFKTIRITYVHLKGAGILVINTGNTYSSFYANARSKTLVKSAKK